MKFPNSYRCLQKNQFTADKYELIPIRYEDRELIRIWRNEQIFHLRQQDELTPEAQDAYFQQTVSRLFDAEQPGQLLFSFLKAVSYTHLTLPTKRIV